MSWLGRWRRSATAVVPTLRNPPGPAPTLLPGAANGTNPIHQLLDDAGVPWREARRDVEARTGIAIDPIYDNQVLFCPDAVRPSGSLQPWQAAIFER